MKKVELDPDNRDWEYDGDGNKIYKLSAGKPLKTTWNENEEVVEDLGKEPGRESRRD